MRADDLPLEIWLHITRFIPDATIRSMIAVNSFFYNLSMDLRYKSLELQRINSRTRILLNRLADPAVGTRVHALTASPDFRFYGTGGRAPSMRDRFQNVLHTFHLAGPILRPEEEGTYALISALPYMTNVKAFTIDSHSWGQHSGPELSTFLSTAWTTFGSNLRKLSLRGHAASFRTIISSQPALPMVEELFFELIDNPLSSTRQADADTLVTVFAPFINSFSSRLQALTLWAWASIELSGLFNTLNKFPLLTCFNFQTSFPRTFRIDPSSLSGFLRNHCSQLDILVLRLNTTPLLHAISTEQRLSEWTLKTFEENHFSRLHELQLYPSALPEGFRGLLSCIQQSADTLQNLVVRERYLDPDDVITLLNVLPLGLRSLRLNLRELNVELFDVITSRLPTLSSLSLYISNVSTTFTSDMEARTFNNLKLHNVGVWQSGSTANEIMRVIGRTIPSVNSFWSLGTTDIEASNDRELEPIVDWSTRNIDDGIH
ncbi:hypothetical protein BDP27DRAFT_1295432 [Rhodocollybia butyracea]|uniref:F-box domain-containing protein n=1 Tax=Rhodocollybia butyracea TaxID=206335 RepID=A0A9P5U6Y1_9AGAR|nr:hypothetical protein BDP27DRAFT_1295432 [Rhodocollybia butyracea]